MAKHNGKHSKPHSQANRAKQSDQVLGIPKESADPPAQTGAHDAASKHGEVEPPVPANQPRLWGRIKPHLTANRAVVFLTLVLAVIAGIQASIYNSQLTEMRIGQRAWLRVKFAPFDMAVNGHACANLIVANTGKTPAKHVYAMAVVRTVPITDPIDFDHPPINASEAEADVTHKFKFGLFELMGTGVVFPDDPTPMNGFCILDATATPTFAQIWTEKLQQQFNSGNIFIDTHGEFKYDDAGGRHHWTRFCGITTASGIYASVAAFKGCIAYNSIDEN